MSTRTTVNIGHGEKPPTVHVYEYPAGHHSRALAKVALDSEAVEIVSHNPADLLAIADACIDAARQLSEALDRAAVPA